MSLGLHAGYSSSTTLLDKRQKFSILQVLKGRRSLRGSKLKRSTLTPSFTSSLQPKLPSQVQSSSSSSKLQAPSSNSCSQLIKHSRVSFNAAIL
ncbi:unnamed protein product [Ilex paraguariensis]|uniref:Uncharacterized protein n=1 Tax=Ilex paraguariensis TaxID=185542 RepID=A0ABC8TA92_9AQUA